MSIRQSSRIRGIEPSISIQEAQRIVGVKRPRESSESTGSLKNSSVGIDGLKTNIPAADTFSFTRSKRSKPSSEPIIGSKKVAVIAPQSVTGDEDVIPLTKNDILRILSREMPMERAAIIENFLRKSNIINQRVKSIYSSYFFRKDIIKEFQSNLMRRIPSERAPDFPLSTYNLYNKDDLLNNTFFRQDRIGTRYTEKTTGYSTESRENIDAIIKLLSKKICSSIGSNYARTAVEKVLDLSKNEDSFDILVVSTRRLEDLTLPIDQRITEIVAFIIVELGECKKYPGSYSINLICTDLKRAIPGTGSILMAAFLYTILSHPSNPRPSTQISFPLGESFLNVTSKRLSTGAIIENATFTTNEPLVPVQQIAVLELASAYTNPGGLCMYEKYGFTYDQTMFSNNTIRPAIDCFADRNNLPMLIDFQTKPGYASLSQEDKKEKILNIAANLDRGFPKSLICNVRDPGKQKLLGELKTIKLYIDNEPGATLDDYGATSIQGSLINQIKIIHSPPSTGSRRTAPPPSRPGTLDEFINYIETPPTTPDPDMESKISKLISFIPKDKKKGGRLTRKKHVNIKRYSRKHY